MKVFLAQKKDKKIWNSFVRNSPYGSFLQSWEWGEFQKSLGRQIWRLVLKDRGKILAVGLFVKLQLPFSYSYLYSPRGPVLSPRSWELKVGQVLLSKITSLARQEKAIFLKIEPKALTRTGFKIPSFFQRARSIQPSHTRILDLSLYLKQLLDNTHPKTRYNIRLARRKGVKIKIDSSIQNLNNFYQFLSQTAQEKHFRLYPKKYFQKMSRSLAPVQMIKVLTAFYQKKPIAAILVIFFGSEASYLFGGAQPPKNVMAPHLLQWSAIKEAKKMGCKKYDFWGVVPLDQTNHPWFGLSRFKMGFGGETVHYLGGWDLVLKPFLYQLYQLTKKIKKYDYIILRRKYEDIYSSEEI